MDSTPTAPWTWADAWILAATSDTGPGHDLSDLIGNADLINHAIPTRDELAGSLGALIASGLVEQSHGRFRTTGQGRAIKKHWRGGLFGWSESLLPKLQPVPRTPNDLPLTEAQVQTAYRDYTRRLKKPKR